METNISIKWLVGVVTGLIITALSWLTKDKLSSFKIEIKELKDELNEKSNAMAEIEHDLALSREITKKIYKDDYLIRICILEQVYGTQYKPYQSRDN